MITLMGLTSDEEIDVAGVKISPREFTLNYILSMKSKGEQMTEEDVDELLKDITAVSAVEIYGSKGNKEVYYRGRGYGNMGPLTAVPLVVG